MEEVMCERMLNRKQYSPCIEEEWFLTRATHGTGGVRSSIVMFPCVEVVIQI